MPVQTPPRPKTRSFYTPFRRSPLVPTRLYFGGRKSTPQRANFSKWGGKSLNRFANIRTGSASSKDGLLVVRCSKKSAARTRRRFSNSMFMKYHFGDASSYVGGTPTSLGVGSITNLDRTYTPSSQDAKHMAWMVLDFSPAQLYWKDHPVGNSTLQTNESPWNMNTTTSTDASSTKAMLLTMDKTPASADPVSRQQFELPASSDSVECLPDQPSVGLAITNGDEEPSVGATTVKWTYKPPNHVIAGFDINLQFNSASVSPQWLTVKLCRNIHSDPLPHGVVKEHMQELLNKQTITDSSVFETVWQHSFFMPGMSTLNGPSNRTFRVQKKVRCNYSRSTTRMESAVNQFTTGIGSDWGAQLSPIFYTSEGTGSAAMYNNMVLAITSRVTDEQYVASVTAVTTDSVSTPSQSASKISTVTNAALRSLSAQTGYAKFGVAGTVTERFKIGAFQRYPPSWDFGQQPIPIHHSSWCDSAVVPSADVPSADVPMSNL